MLRKIKLEPSNIPVTFITDPDNVAADAKVTPSNVTYLFKSPSVGYAFNSIGATAGPSATVGA